MQIFEILGIFWRKKVLLGNQILSNINFGGFEGFEGLVNGGWKGLGKNGVKENRMRRLEKITQKKE